MDTIQCMRHSSNPTLISTSLMALVLTLLNAPYIEKQLKYIICSVNTAQCSRAITTKEV